MIHFSAVQTEKSLYCDTVHFEGTERLRNLIVRKMRFLLTRFVEMTAALTALLLNQ